MEEKSNYDLCRELAQELEDWREVSKEFSEKELFGEEISNGIDYVERLFGELRKRYRDYLLKSEEN